MWQEWSPQNNPIPLKVPQSKARHFSPSMESEGDGEIVSLSAVKFCSRQRMPPCSAPSLHRQSIDPTANTGLPPAPDGEDVQFNPPPGQAFQNNKKVLIATNVAHKQDGLEPQNLILYRD